MTFMHLILLDLVLLVVYNIDKILYWKYIIAINYVFLMAYPDDTHVGVVSSTFGMKYEVLFHVLFVLNALHIIG